MAGRTHTNISIKKLNLQKGQNFTLHYDYGDDWLFIIHTQSIDVAEPGSCAYVPYIWTGR